MITVTRKWNEERVRKMECDFKISHTDDLINVLVGIIHNEDPSRVCYGGYTQEHLDTYETVLKEFYKIHLADNAEEQEAAIKNFESVKDDEKRLYECRGNVLQLIIPTEKEVLALFNLFEDESYDFVRNDEYMDCSEFECVELGDVWNGYDEGLTVAGPEELLKEDYNGS